MARALSCLAAAASVALLATPAAAQSAGDAGLRYLSWPGRPAQTATPQPPAADYGLRGAEVVPASSPRRPDRYSGGGDQSLQARYYERRQSQSADQPRYEEPRQPQPEPRYEAAAYEPRYSPPPRLTQPSAPQQPRPDVRPEPRPEPRYEQQQPSQTIQIQPPAAGYTPRAAAEQPPVRQQAESQPQPQSQPSSGQPAASGDSVRYYSVHRGAGRQPDPIEQTYVSPQDAMVALAPPSGTSLAERERQAMADEVALNLIRQLPPEQLALLLDTPQ